MAVDPLWSDVVLLAPFNGVAGQDSFIYELAKQRQFIPIGSAPFSRLVDSPPPRFGPTSLFINDSGRGVQLAAHADWNLADSDFTIECWYYSGTTAGSSGIPFFSWWENAALQRGWEFYREANTSRVAFRWSTTGNDTPAPIVSSAGSAWPAAWVHVCAMRKAGTLYLFVDGIMVGSGPVGTIYNANRPLSIGRRGGASSPAAFGGIDEARITLAARYSEAGFTPPDSPFAGDGTNPARATQGQQLIAAGGVSGVSRITSAVALILQAPVVPSRITQAVALVAEPGFRPAQITQAMQLVLAQESRCVTSRAQIWTITRRDGEVFRFTSHDRPIERNGGVYSPCRSLDPTASENASALGSVGNIELTGIIDDDSISEADLYGGRFDDAYVEVDLIDWSDQSAMAVRIASGWTGEMSQGVASFSMEVLGGGSRLDQQALVQMISPSCRWVFGDAGTCKVDREALKMTGEVVAARSRGAFSATIVGDGEGRQWENGTVRWTSGQNAGQVCEIKTLHIGDGAVVLWSPASYPPAPGDAFDLLPGCDLARSGGCTLYANVINFGGFPDVPGQDSLLETPNAQY